MKKPYTKPMLYAETFELMEHIAACSLDDNVHIHVTARENGPECSYTDNGLTLYQSDRAACLTTYDEGMDGTYADYLESLMKPGGVTCYNAFASIGTPFYS